MNHHPIPHVEVTIHEGDDVIQTKVYNCVFWKEGQIVMNHKTGQKMIVERLLPPHQWILRKIKEMK